MSDVWDDNSDDGLAERHWQQMNEEFGNYGYLQGIEDGKEQSLQQGFDFGLQIGRRIGLEVGILQGTFAVLNHFGKTNIDKDQLHEQTSQKNLLPRSHFVEYATSLEKPEQVNSAQVLETMEREATQKLTILKESLNKSS